MITLAPAIGLIAGAAVGVLLAALGVIGIGWGIVDGAAIGLIIGAIVGALAKGSGPEPDRPGDLTP